jgi:hypothetical protein
VAIAASTKRRRVWADRAPPLSLTPLAVPDLAMGHLD